MQKTSRLNRKVLLPTIVRSTACPWVRRAEAPNELGRSQAHLRRVRRPALVAQAISNHVHSLIAADLADVNSRDEHTVKAWFTWKLDYSPPVVDLAEAGFLLIGGRIDMLNQRLVAAIVVPAWESLHQSIHLAGGEAQNRPECPIRSRLPLVWLEQGRLKLLVYCGRKRHRIGGVRG
jgi:anti-sigma factor RsiW